MMTEDDLRNQVFIQAAYDPDEAEKERIANKLKEPRDLYSTASLQHIPKWPIECQVLPEKIRHIEKVHPRLESFYNTTNTENQPKPVGEEMGTVIYNYNPKLSVDYFCRACAGGSSELEVFENDPNSLRFESRFESGNLAKAIKITSVYYELYLRPDMYTDRHSQWFYFRIQNTKENVTYRLSIVNLNKPDSLYKYGMKPLLYSEKEAQLNNKGWVRCGQNIAYYKNDIMVDDNNSFYTLTFTLKFRHSNDTVYLAQCYPYTYTNLQNYLASIEADERRAKLCQQRLLCRSLAGNNIYVLTITSPDNSNEDLTSTAKKPVIVLSARVHPGETQSSYMMKGIIDFLTSSAPQAKELRDRFIFKLIPMLNPDGVIVGNSRCCLLGQDLNRQYRTVLREAFPQIYHTKVMLRRLMDENGIFLYCDLHGHSRRNNVFMYGCENKRVPEKRLIEQVFPLMMHKNGSDKFSFQNCKFKIQRSKEGTGRVFAWTIGVDLSYTLEISLGGSTMPSRPNTHFNTYDYEAVGRHFCETLLDYSDPGNERLKERILQKLLDGGSTADEPLNIPLTDYSSLSHSESDSEDEANVDETEARPVLKRTVSFRRQISLRSSNKTKAKTKPTTLKVERSVMHLTKASVSYVKNRTRKNGDTELPNKEEDKGKPDSMSRLSKFRKRSKKVNFTVTSTSVTDKNTSSQSTLITTKCTNILFDDPFNPPGRDTLNVKTSTSAEELGAFSVTEDECDDSDGAFKNVRFLRRSSVELVEEFAMLQLSPFAKRHELVGEQNTVPYPAPSKMNNFGMLDYRSLVTKPPPTVYESAPDVKKPETQAKPKRPVLVKQASSRRPSLNCTRLSTVKESKVHALSASTNDLTSDSFTRRTVISTLTKSSLSQRRVSWTGTSIGSTPVSHPLVSLAPMTSSTSVTRSSSQRERADNSSSGASKANSQRVKMLQKSKSVGDRSEELNRSSSFHASSSNNAAAKKRKTKLKRTKSKK